MSRASCALLGGGRSIGLPDNRDANGFSRLRVFADYANPPHADERVFPDILRDLSGLFGARSRIESPPVKIASRAY